MYISDNPHPGLAYLHFRRLLPSPLLQPYIQCFWVMRTRVEEQTREHMYPDGGSGMIFNFGDPLELESHILTRASLQGVEMTSRRVCLEGQVDTLGVRFHPGGGAWFSAALLCRDGVFEGDSFTAPMESLAQELFDLPNTQERIGTLERRMRSWLAKSVHSRDADQLLIGHARTLLANTHGPRVVRRVATQLGLSERHLERIFRKRVGITPKALARLARVEKARQWLKEPAGLSLSQIALEAGFFDQAHFSHEFRRVTGTTPKQYRDRARSRAARRDQENNRAGATRTTLDQARSFPPGKKASIFILGRDSCIQSWRVGDGR